MAISSSQLHHFLLPAPSLSSSFTKLVPTLTFCSSINFNKTQLGLFSLSCPPSGVYLHRERVKPILAALSSKEAIRDVKTNANVVIESQDEDKVQVRVELSGKETDKVFGKVLNDLARTAPPVPGFRRQKGGKTTKVPRDFLLQAVGKDRVTNFVIQEIINSSMGDFVKKENLVVKENKIDTIQTAEELKKLFTPGNEFVFNVVLELEKPEEKEEEEASTEEEAEEPSTEEEEQQ